MSDKGVDEEEVISDAVATIYLITQLCGFYLRVYSFIKLSVISKIFCKCTCKSFEKSQLYMCMINEKLRCGDLVLEPAS